jgi:hypothetical protein
MPKRIVPLSEMEVRNAKPRAKTYALYDGGGLCLEVTPHASKLWRMAYRRADGSRSRLAFGPYPEITLQEAREKRLEAHRLLLKGIDPARERDQAKRAAKERAATTFELIAREWHANKVPTWSERTANNMIQRLQDDIFPAIGSMPIEAITHKDVIAALKAIEARGAHEVAHRTKAVLSLIFSYAIQLGHIERNLAADMKDVLKTVRPGHFAAISVDELPQFIRALERNEARLFQPTRIALRLIMLIFVRTSELLDTPWSEVDLMRGEWVIPWRRMKRGRLAVNPGYH